jgi:hypothetical protein
LRDDTDIASKNRFPGLLANPAVEINGFFKSEINKNLSYPDLQLYMFPTFPFSDLEILKLVNMKPEVSSRENQEERRKGNDCLLWEMIENT